jgi:SWI/SNF-related matrix-associated actin-dependent regulator of chromatin subfamily A3
MKKGQNIFVAYCFITRLTISLYRIPYVRFDGKMSAKRRQETLETFCIPIGHDAPEIANAHSTPIIPMSEGQQTRRSARSSRRGEASVGEYQQADVNDDEDEDFVPQMDADSHDGARTRKKKGKAKAKGKSKAVARSDLAPVGNTAVNGVNPKVMLISLKAGALGLNLTAANNIYL